MTTRHRDDELHLVEGDCVAAMRELPEASVDAVVCDPPYHLSFMGKSWDHAPTPAESQAAHARWATEAFRVLKPGGHLLAFGGTRTYHRLACAVEDAGFEIRDQLAWMYGSGFPKSLDVSKAVDKTRGVDVGADERWTPTPHFVTGAMRTASGTSQQVGQALPGERVLYEPDTDDAKQWQGWGTALKPAYEPIVLARKPLAGTVAANVLEHGTGALNIDACRVAFAGSADEEESKQKNRHGDFGTQQGGNAVYGDYSMLDDRENYDAPGRWPANVVLGHHDECRPVGTRTVSSDGHYPAARGAGGLSTTGHAGEDGLAEAYTNGEVIEAWDCHPDCPVRLLDEQSGVQRDGVAVRRNVGHSTEGLIPFAQGTRDAEMRHDVTFGGGGGASRFFYCAKASRSERDEGLAHLPLVETDTEVARNHHPTVKPIDTMRWLIRLVCRRGGVVLDPFMGSGTTGIAALREECRFIGIERDAAYMEIALARLAHHQVRNLTLEV